MRFRKKPVVVEAERFDNLSKGKEICQAMAEQGCSSTLVEQLNSNPSIFIHTLEGEMKADLGDWIIKGVKGEFYPCKPDIFNETYEEVTE